MTISFPMLGKFSPIIFSNIFSDPFSFSSSPATPIIQMLECLMLSQRSLRLSSILFILFSLFWSTAVISAILSSLTYMFFCLSYSAIASFYCIFNFSYCVVHHCLFFSSSRSLLNVSCILSIVFLRFWISLLSLL